MNSLISLVQFQSERSHSVLVDVQQKYVRNVILFGTALSAIRQLFGEVISCQGRSPQSLSDSFLETRCYINGTVTADLYHDYYQFTSVYLLVLALAVQFPYWVWVQLVGYKVRELEKLASLPEVAIQAIHHSKNLFLQTVLLESVYLPYWIGLLYLTNRFFNGYGSQFYGSWRVIPKLFPDMGTCAFTYFQESGGSSISTQCLLPLSSVYRKVFAVLYGIVAFLLPFHVMVLAYRAVHWTRRPRNVLERDWALQIVKSSTVSWSVRRALHTAVVDKNDIV